MSRKFSSTCKNIFALAMNRYDVALRNFTGQMGMVDRVTGVSVGVVTDPVTGRQYGYKLQIGKPGVFDDEGY